MAVSSAMLLVPAAQELAELVALLAVARTTTPMPIGPGLPVQAPSV